MEKFMTVGVVGAGAMGTEIALVFALAGHPAIISDQNRGVADKALDRLRGVLERGVGRTFWTKDAAERAIANVRAVEGLEDYGDRDLIIEAVFEDEAIKRNIFTRLDKIIAPNAGVSSNTSSISITSLATGLSEGRRKRFIGTHFFSPVSRMQLVEVIPGLDTDPSYADAISETLRTIGKTPIRVKDVVGFRDQSPAACAGDRIDPSGRGGHLYTGRYRSWLQARPRSSDRTVRTARQHDQYTIARRPRYSVQSLRRALPAAAAAAADGGGRI